MKKAVVWKKFQAAASVLTEKIGNAILNFIKRKGLIPVKAGEYFLGPGHGKAGRHIGRAAKEGKPFFLHFLLQKSNQPGKSKGTASQMRLCVAEHIGEGCRLFRIHQLLQIAQIHRFPSKRNAVCAKGLYFDSFLIICRISL